MTSPLRTLWTTAATAAAALGLAACSWVAESGIEGSPPFSELPAPVASLAGGGGGGTVGFSRIGDTPIVAVASGTLRTQGIKVHASSSEPMQACVKSGYVIGRDPATQAKSDAHLLDFLAPEFQR